MTRFKSAREDRCCWNYSMSQNVLRRAPVGGARKREKKNSRGLFSARGDRMYARARGFQGHEYRIRTTRTQNSVNHKMSMTKLFSCPLKRAARPPRGSPSVFLFLFKGLRPAAQDPIHGPRAPRRTALPDAPSRPTCFAAPDGLGSQTYDTPGRGRGSGPPTRRFQHLTRSFR